MSVDANAVSIESDERGFELHVWVDEDPRISEDGHFVLNIHNIDLSAFYDQVKARLGPYIHEMDAARQAVARGVTLEAFVCAPADVDESGGYDAGDPKSPRYHSTHVDLWDAREGK